MYQQFKESDGYLANDFLRTNLSDFTGAVLDEWCGGLFLVTQVYSDVENSEHNILFVVTGRHNERVVKGNVSYVPTKTRVGILSNGDIVTFDSATYKTGNQTYTGDTYIDCYNTHYTVKNVLYSSEIFSEFAAGNDITSEQIESVAVELAGEIVDFHKQTEFHK